MTEQQEAKQELAPIQRYSNDVQRFAKQYASALPPECGVTAEMFTANAIAYAGKNDAILTYEPRSVMSCLYEGARLGLMPDGAIPGFHIVGFWSGKLRRNVGTFIVDYKAVLELAVRSGMLRSINPGVVYTRDKFAFGLRNGEPFIEHEWDLDASTKERGDLRGVYCTGILPDGSKARPVWMNLAELEDYARKYAVDKHGKVKGLWAGDDRDRLVAYRKTIVRQFLTFVPKSASNLAMSTRLGDAFHADAKGSVGLTPNEDLPPVRDTDATVSNPGARQAEKDLGVDDAAEFEPPVDPDTPADIDPGDVNNGGDVEHGADLVDHDPQRDAVVDEAERAAQRQAQEQARAERAAVEFEQTCGLAWDIGTRFFGMTIAEISGSHDGILYLHDALARLDDRPELKRRLQAFFAHPTVAADLEDAQSQRQPAAE